MTPSSEVTPEMLAEGRGAWLDKRGFSDDDVLTAIYLAMKAKDQPIALDPVQDVRNRIAVEVEGDSDSPLRVAEANAIYDGLRDDNYPEIIAAKNMSQPIALDEVERAVLDDEVDQLLRGFHFETFRAGICYERDEWPHSDEEWAELNRGIQSEAVGEHYEGWADDTLGKLLTRLAALVRQPVTEVRERPGSEGMRPDTGTGQGQGVKK